MGRPLITFDGVTKRFADGTVAVNDLTLEVEKGEVVVLVGPSGCGKTTTMRMVNRMLEPTSGTLSVDGQDVMRQDPPTLRRGIGYVIQQVGLFPHRTIAGNIATVPQLEGWDKRRIEERVSELIETVGLPSSVADRYPHQLSGGQRQRVGVARALATDPSVMLMDEPFGAVDPIVRARLQEEFLRLQREVLKTIVFVTHDIDEAITMGDRIAIFSQGGNLEQHATPRDILADPANQFVADFLGEERGLKRLALIAVSEVDAEPGPTVAPEDTTERAEEVARAHGTDWVVVVSADRRLEGWASLHELHPGQPLANGPLRAFALKVRAEDSLRAALNAMVTGHTGAAVRVSRDDRYEGIITQDLVSKEIR
ncbi:MAG: betaine/proline/choline family ABC transporter ATP-binding protein [Nitriliruptorales bacterium]|nr:betaine/proline/choline family ABC transporter ATP-binding protein [Nitriliruptorales bacterium]